MRAQHMNAAPHLQTLLRLLSNVFYELVRIYLRRAFRVLNCAGVVR
ncbi:hypothetical protein ABID21_004711 [Pseudorhizobium tarimense]|uniref:Transposase n=1 Tax=Pseudorhizobium tarimense TaxID=1079109 RepID=A0ABV2HDF1_9HYPH